jgi:hypothetical protein
VTVAAPAYTLVAASPLITMSDGSSSTVTLNLTSTNYAGTVVFSTSLNSQISASAPQVVLTNGGSGTSTVTITTATSAANHVPWSGRGAALLCAVLLAMPFGRLRKRACAVLLTALAISLAGFLIACGAGTASTQRLTRTYVVTVTPSGSGTVTNPAPVSIIVQIP